MYAAEIGARPVHVGRGLDNQLILSEGTISTHHAALWVEGGRAFVRDQGSRNGTFVNDERVHGAADLRDGDVVRLGTSVEIVIRGEAGAQPIGRAWVVEALDSGVRYPVDGSRFYIGSGENANLRIDGGEHEAALQFHGDDEVWLATFDDDRPLEPGSEFCVGASRYRVLRAPNVYTPTSMADDASAQYRYRLTVTLDGVSGPEAVLEDPGSRRSASTMASTSGSCWPTRAPSG